MQKGASSRLRLQAPEKPKGFAPPQGDADGASGRSNSPSADDEKQERDPVAREDEEEEEVKVHEEEKVPNVAIHQAPKLVRTRVREIPHESHLLWVNHCYPVLFKYVNARADGNEKLCEESLVELLGLVDRLLSRVRGGRREKGDVSQYLERDDNPVRNRRPEDRRDEIVENKQPQQDADERKVAKAMKLMRNRATGVQGALTRAARMITSEDELDTKPTMVEELKRLHPEGKQVAVTEEDKKQRFIITDIKRLKSLVIAGCNGAAAGPSGWTMEMLLPLVKCDNCLPLLNTVMLDIVNGNVKGEAARRLTAVKGVLVRKPNKPNGRPIGIPEVLAKLGSQWILRELDIPSMLPSMQFGVGSKCGTEQVYHRVARATAANPDEKIPDPVGVLLVDFKNAFNCVQRQAMLEAIRNKGPKALAWFVLAYGGETDLLFPHQDGVAELKSREGVRQGDPLASLFFCLALQPSLEKARDAMPGLKEWDPCAFIDDVSIIGPLEVIKRRFQVLREEAQKIGLEVNMAKTELLWPHADFESAKKVAESLGVACVRVAKLMGAPIGTKALMRKRLQTMVDEKKLKMKLLHHKKMSCQVATLILRKSQQHAFGFIGRMIGPDVAQPQLHRFDNVVIKELQQITLTDWSRNKKMESEIRDRLRLPTRQGGFGLLATGERAPASFIVATARALSNIDFIMPDAASNANPYDVAVMNALRQVKEELEKLMIEKKSLAPFDNWTKFKARCVKARGEEYWVHELYTMARLARVVGWQPRGMGAGADEKKGGEEVKADGKQAISQKHIIEACGSSGMLFLDAHLIDQWTQLSNEEFCHVVRMHLNVDGQSYCPMCNQKVPNLRLHVLWCRMCQVDRTELHTGLQNTMEAIHRLVGMHVARERTIFLSVVPENGSRRVTQTQNGRLDLVAQSDEANGNLYGLDNTVIAELAPSNLGKGHMSQRAHRKKQKYERACQKQKLKFVPLVVNELGKLHVDFHAWLHKVVNVWMERGLLRRFSSQNEALRYVTLRVVTTVLKRDFLIYRKHGLPNFQFY